MRNRELGVPDRPSPLHQLHTRDNSTTVRRNTQSNDEARRLDNIIEDSNRALEDTGESNLISQMRSNLRGQKEIDMKTRELNFILGK